MAYVTIENPETGERCAIPEEYWLEGTDSLDEVDEEGVPLVNPHAGWIKIADGAPEHNESVIVNGAWDNLPGVKARLWERVKEIRAERETAIAPTPLGDVQIDEKSKAKIMGALDLCKLQEETQQPFAMNFTLADNSRVLLNNVTVRQLAGAAGLYVSQIYDYSWVLRDLIGAAASVEELAAIDVEAGWPGGS